MSLSENADVITRHIMAAHGALAAGRGYDQTQALMSGGTWRVSVSMQSPPRIRFSCTQGRILAEVQEHFATNGWTVEAGLTPSYVMMTPPPRQART